MELLLLTAVIAYALAIYAEAIRWLPYHRDETLIPMAPLPQAPVPPPAR